MRKLLLLLAMTLVSLGLAGSASAAPVNWEGTSILLLGDFPPANVTGGGVATINVGGGGQGPDHIDSIRIAASRGNVAGNFTQLVTDPETISNQIFAIQFIDIQGLSGTLTPISGGLDPAATGYNGRLPVAGLVKLCLLNTECSVTADLQLTQPDPTRPGGIKGVGVGGLLTINVLTGFANISINAKPLQIAQATLVDQIEMPTPDNNITFINVQVRGFAHGPSSASSTTGATTTAMTPTPDGNITVTGRGVIQLISPSQVLTNLTTGTSDKIAAGQTFIIRFIPEPGLLLLIGSGVAGLALLGRSRMRK
ncbi:MAG: hypothetical protein ACR2P8_15655 [Myxococcota bacterium]